MIYKLLAVFFSFVMIAPLGMSRTDVEAEDILRKHIARTESLLKDADKKIEKYEEDLRSWETQEKELSAEYNQLADERIAAQRSQPHFEDLSTYTQRMARIRANNRVTQRAGRAFDSWQHSLRQVRSLQENIEKTRGEITKLFDSLENKQNLLRAMEIRDLEHADIILAVNEKRIDLLKLSELAHLLLGDFKDLGQDIEGKIRETNMGKYVDKRIAEALAQSCARAAECSKNGDVVNGLFMNGRVLDVERNLMKEQVVEPVGKDDKGAVKR